jgi:hypothetical protein
VRAPRYSAFKESIYGGLPPEYYTPVFQATRDYYAALGPRQWPKSFMVHDAALMYYRPFESVASSLREPDTPWRRIVHSAVETREYRETVEATAWHVELAALAAAKFLRRVLEEGDPRRLRPDMMPGMVTFSTAENSGNRW